MNKARTPSTCSSMSFQPMRRARSGAPRRRRLHPAPRLAEVSAKCDSNTSGNKQDPSFWGQLRGYSILYIYFVLML